MRLLLNIVEKIQKESSKEGSGDEKLLTAPPDLWSDKPVDESKWYFKSQEHIISSMMTTDSLSDVKKGELVSVYTCICSVDMNLHLWALLLMILHALSTFICFISFLSH